MKDVSVIIVNWNARTYLRDCLHSILRTSESVVREIIVVDNASNDGSPRMVSEEFPTVQLICARENLGFARANNLGLRQATGSYLAFVNSDVIIHGDCFERLRNHLDEHPEAGLVGPRVFGADGTQQLTYGPATSIWNMLVRMLALDKAPGLASAAQGPRSAGSGTREVEVLIGCFWFARRRAIEEIGELDETFFFYGEDFDWCKRFRTAGWKIRLISDASITHFGGGSSSNAPLVYSVQYLRSGLVYFRKHHGIAGWMFFYWLSIVMHLMRLVARALIKAARLDRSPRSEGKLQEHWACLRWLLTGRDTRL